MDQHYGFLLIRASQEHIPLPGCWQRGLFQQEKCDSEAAEAGSEPRGEVGARQEAGSCISKDWRVRTATRVGQGRQPRGCPASMMGMEYMVLTETPPVLSSSAICMEQPADKWEGMSKLLAAQLLPCSCVPQLCCGVRLWGWAQFAGCAELPSLIPSWAQQRSGAAVSSGKRIPAHRSIFSCSPLP